MFFTVVNKSALPAIYVDINGVSGPNVMGIDIFLFILTKKLGKEELKPYSVGAGDNSCKSPNLYSAWCIIKDDWKINYKY